ncbi:MAG: lipopolysaccharide biosynthesis protein RfbH [Opitutales bacterium]|nr:lipopolysaccharide biosynthesis protein RfbH [Opitutales bacterium]
MSRKPEDIRTEILHLVKEYSILTHQANYPPELRNTLFIPEQSAVPYAGRVFDHHEVVAAVDSTLEFWLTLGKEGAAFEKELAAYLGVRQSVLTNSGSSANLLAVSAITSHKIQPEKRLRKGDEVITCAAGFPTTVSPIVQVGAIPVFLDNDPLTGNIRADFLEEAYNPGKTKAVVIAHTLGNPFDLKTVLGFCRKYDLWLIEDNCDALGCSYTLKTEDAKTLELDHLLRLADGGEHTQVYYSGQKKEYLTAPTGCFGDISTQSFYPPHHLTLGEGGAVNIVRDFQLKIIVESIRDWGRDCYCPSGVDNTCKKRFQWQLGDLPEGYDHKYIYSHLGYNIKPLDIQAAIGRQQLRKLNYFIEARKQNWEYLRRGLGDLDDLFEFTLPTHASCWVDPKGSNLELKSQFEWSEEGAKVDPSWFGFMILVKPTAPFSKSELAAFLDERKIGNRMLFGGNLLRQPVFVQLKKDDPDAFRVVGALKGADRIMNEAIFVGTYPGLSNVMLDYVVTSIKEFVISRCQNGNS